MNETLNMVAGGCLKIGLIALGVLALLFGACAMLAGANYLGGPWPPKFHTRTRGRRIPARVACFCEQQMP